MLDSRSAKSLFVFDKERLFIKTIGSIGNGPGEYTSIDDFTIDFDEKRNYNNWQWKKIDFYDIFTGKFLRTVVTQQYPITIIQYYNGMIYADLHEYPQTAKDCIMQTIDISTWEQKVNI